MIERSMDRRSLIRTAAIGGAGLTAGAVLGGGAIAAASSGGESEDRRSLIVEVALVGPTTRNLPPAFLWNLIPELGQELDEGDLRGATWYAEGVIYPEGTIRGEGFIPTDADSIGVWFCRGHTMSHVERPEPHVITQQEHVFGSLDDEPLGADVIYSTGFEGREGETWLARRAVIGGTGAYRSARGDALQEQFSTNSTDFPWGQKAPNFRFEFDIDVSR